MEVLGYMFFSKLKMDMLDVDCYDFFLASDELPNILGIDPFIFTYCFCLGLLHASLKLDVYLPSLFILALLTGLIIFFNLCLSSSPNTKYGCIH